MLESDCITFNFIILTKKAPGVKTRGYRKDCQRHLALAATKPEIIPIPYVLFHSSDWPQHASAMATVNPGALEDAPPDVHKRTPSTAVSPSRTTDTYQSPLPPCEITNSILLG
ncbi:MAG: hypothetical protein COX30_04175 [Candidatus Moranbacteria bacterium CG23_combo_of_CG06-09_8_20_14_all_39_10]|nr:MAG: hypothetical protein COX30_04175 [Candidatus Moranbacteria bacterium CG23_combo_of_CG06-09_8_20_14_all_39_10]